MRVLGGMRPGPFNGGDLGAAGEISDRNSTCRARPPPDARPAPSRSRELEHVDLFSAARSVELDLDVSLTWPRLGSKGLANRDSPPTRAAVLELVGRRLRSGICDHMAGSWQLEGRKVQQADVSAGPAHGSRLHGRVRVGLENTHRPTNTSHIQHGTESTDSLADQATDAGCGAPPSERGARCRRRCRCRRRYRCCCRCHQEQRELSRSPQTRHVHLGVQEGHVNQVGSLAQVKRIPRATVRDAARVAVQCCCTACCISWYFDHMAVFPSWPLSRSLSS